MIKIKDKTRCCGCTACASICPKHCISMKEDKEGFLYPEADASLCVECGACEKVCPVTYAGEARQPLHCYAANNKDVEVLRNSSSGGIFSLLAQYVLQEKHGVVFGAMWEGERVVHGAIESLDVLYRLRGSKYVQSDMRGSFKQVSAFLKDGRYILFSGTPCEIAGLRSYLKKDYDNLLTVDLACHGVPSPKVLSLYIQELKDKYGVESLQLNFKDKSTGWATYSVTAKSGDKTLFSERATENIYMKGYLHELFSRPSCHDCAFKSFRSGSDITLADFWGIKNLLPNYTSEDGVSLVIINTDKGARSIASTSDGEEMVAVGYEESIRENSALIQSELPHPNRKSFFRYVSHGKKISLLIGKNLSLHWITSLRLILRAKLGIQ